MVRNHEDTAVDISGWSVSGSLAHTFKPGTVIPAGERLYVVRDVQGFQARTTGPGGGQALILQGNYQGDLSRFGGSLSLWSADQTEVAQLTYQGASLQGDYNGDGSVDAVDYAVWRESRATDGDLTGDGNGDLIVDQADYDLWAGNYGATESGAGGGAGSGSVAQALPPTESLEPQELENSLESISWETNFVWEVTPGPTSPPPSQASALLQAPVAPASFSNDQTLLLAFQGYQDPTQRETFHSEPIDTIAQEIAGSKNKLGEDLAAEVWGLFA